MPKYVFKTLFRELKIFVKTVNSFKFAKHVFDGAFKILHETIAISLFAYLLMPVLVAGDRFTCHACMLTTHCLLMTACSLTNLKCEAD